MSGQYEFQVRNGNKRKVSHDIEETDFHQNKSLITNSGSPSMFSLIQTFLKEQQSKGEREILDIPFQLHWWQRDYLVFKFLELVVKILALELKNSLNHGSQDVLRDVLEDIEAFGLDILGLLELPENICTTIVTKALQVSKDYVLDGDNKNDGVVKVEPKPTKGLISGFINFLVKTLVNFLFPKIDPSMFLVGDFGPIREETSPNSEVKVIGEIPTNLNGMLIRNGPNPPFDPVANYGWLDGDSMIHAIRFKEGKATYVSRYVQTSRFKQEQFFNGSEFLQYGDLEGPFGVLMSCVQLLKAKLGVLDMSYGWLNADTGLVYHNGTLMILQDFDKPYVVNISQNGDLKTLGITDYNKHLTYSFLPHPKKDPLTGELFIVGVSYTPPYAIYNYVSKEGSMSSPVTLTVSGPTYMHDLGITKNHVIFMDLPYCYDPENMVKHDDFIYSLDISKKSRFGIMGKYATSEDNSNGLSLIIVFSYITMGTLGRKMMAQLF